MSLLDLAENDREGGMQGMKNASALDQQRTATNQSLKTQHKARQMNAISSGVGTGMMAASMFGGPIGVGVGAAAMILGGLF